MTHRIDLEPDDRDGDRRITIRFQGLLDPTALAELERLSQAERRSGWSVRVQLGSGTRVEAGLLERLARIEGIAVTAESPFLSRWLERCLPAS